jgi:hypothetical protein
VTLKQVLQLGHVYLSMIKAEFLSDLSGLQTSVPQFGHLAMLNRPSARLNLLNEILNIRIFVDE